MFTCNAIMYFVPRFFGWDCFYCFWWCWVQVRYTLCHIKRHSLLKPRAGSQFCTQDKSNGKWSITPRQIGSLNKDVSTTLRRSSENVTWRFCNHFSIIQRHLAWKTWIATQLTFLAGCYVIDWCKGPRPLLVDSRYFDPVTSENFQVLQSMLTSVRW